MSLSRRDFLLYTAGAIGSVRSRRIGTPAEPLRIGLVATDGASSTALGARLGAEEAARAATLFGSAVEMLTAADPSALLDGHVQVLIGGGDAAAQERLSTLADRRGVLLLNVGTASDAAVTEQCRAHTFHVAPSRAMRRTARDATGAAASEIVAWHETLTQYGAAQLNDRFRARFGTAMSDDAWVAWMAVKIVSEASLRTRSVASESLTAYLTRPGVRFDGHKGRPLWFGVADHQLQQPIYRLHLDANGVANADEIRGMDSVLTQGTACTSAHP